MTDDSLIRIKAPVIRERQKEYCAGSIFRINATMKKQSYARARFSSFRALRTGVQTVRRWLQVARVGEIADREWKVISIKGADIALFNVNGQYFAIDETLTHLSSAPSADSFTGDCVMNSWHTSEPRADAGSLRKEHAYEAARTFPVRVRDGIIEVGEEAG